MYAFSEGVSKKRKSYLNVIYFPLNCGEIFHFEAALLLRVLCFHRDLHSLNILPKFFSVFKCI